MLTLEQLVGADIPATQAREFLPHLNTVMDRFDITTPARRAAFIAQTAHESAKYTCLEENLYYRSAERILEIWPKTVKSLQTAQFLAKNPQKLANFVYGNKNGNRGPDSGDGWTYRGRGLIQLTGRDNYLNAENDLGKPFLVMPEMVGLPADACLTAGWYWNSRKLNVLADAALWDEITRGINPGESRAGVERRRQMTEEALQVFA